MKYCFLITLFFGSAFSFANEKLSYKPLGFIVSQGDQLVVKGFKGRIQFTSNESTKEMTVNVSQVIPQGEKNVMEKAKENWSFTAKKEGQVIYLIVAHPQSKKDWNDLLIQGGAPQFFLSVVSPSIPAQIYWDEGQISMTGWKQPLRINQRKGDVTINGGEGTAELFCQEGSVEVSSRKGNIDIESYSTEVKLNNLEGKVAIDNFSGNTKIQSHKGDIDLKSFKGKSEIIGGEGRIDFDNRQTLIKIDRFEGTVRGSSGQGGVIAHLSGKTNFSVNTNEGNVSLNLPGSGANLNLGSKEGKMFIPSYLNVTRYPAMKVARGRLRGSADGFIRVRTDSGTIQIQ